MKYKIPTFWNCCSCRKTNRIYEDIKPIKDEEMQKNAERYSDAFFTARCAHCGYVQEIGEEGEDGK